MRAAADPRDAALISVLASAGLRPGEALALQWDDVRDNTLLVERALSLGEEADTKTTMHRTVRLLALPKLTAGETLTRTRDTTIFSRAVSAGRNGEIPGNTRF
jgi:integrase